MKFTFRDCLWLCLVLTMGFCWWLETQSVRMEGLFEQAEDPFDISADYIKQGGGS